jgi:hypothetical protein
MNPSMLGTFMIDGCQLLLKLACLPRLTTRTGTAGNYSLALG